MLRSKSTLKQAIRLTLAAIFSAELLLLNIPTAFATTSSCKKVVEDETPPVFTTEEFVLETNEHLMRVPEFRFIREAGTQLGLRVWLFGGTAAAYSHYQKWDGERKRGLRDLQADRFDYDFTNIFRSTQDLDLVVDGPPDAALSFQQLLANKFPYFLGSKLNAWEVRALRFRIGNPGDPQFKEALLGDADFRNQNTDSNSVGMVELTQSAEPIYRDLRNWDEPINPFLSDVLNSRIHYHRSNKHFETARAKNGENPEILSVLRMLVKSFQYDLTIPPEDFLVIQSIADEFEPLAIKNAKALQKIEETAKKLVIHAVNIEYAINTLEKLGLRRKLISMGSPNNLEGAAYWLNREPMRRKEVGQGTGLTAAQLGVETVAHETSNFLAYESITRAHSGEPNVFISRDGFPRESADHGDGFYTLVGTSGAPRSGMTIRFLVDPNAREGSDFQKIGETVIFHNKKALRVIQETLNLSVDQLIAAAKSNTLIEVDRSDGALIEKIKRKLDGTDFEKKTTLFLLEAVDHFILGMEIAVSGGSNSQTETYPKLYALVDLLKKFGRKDKLPNLEFKTSIDGKIGDLQDFIVDRILNTPSSGLENLLKIFENSGVNSIIEYFAANLMPTSAPRHAKIKQILIDRLKSDPDGTSEFFTNLLLLDHVPVYTLADIIAAVSQISWDKIPEAQNEKELQEYIRFTGLILYLTQESRREVWGPYQSNLIEIIESSTFTEETKKLALAELILIPFNHSHWSWILSDTPIRWGGRHKEIEKIYSTSLVLEFQKELQHWPSSADPRKRNFARLLTSSQTDKYISPDSLKSLVNSGLAKLNGPNLGNRSFLLLAARHLKEGVDQKKGDDAPSSLLRWLVHHPDYDFRLRDSYGFTDTENLRLLGMGPLADWIEKIRPEAKGRDFEVLPLVPGQPVLGFVEFQPGKFPLVYPNDPSGFSHQEFSPLQTELTQKFEIFSVKTTAFVWNKIATLLKQQIGGRYKALPLRGGGSETEDLNPLRGISPKKINTWLEGLTELSALPDSSVQDFLKSQFPGHKKGDVYRLPTFAEQMYVEHLVLRNVPEEEYIWSRHTSLKGGLKVGQMKPLLFQGRPIYDLHGLLYELLSDNLMNKRPSRSKSGPLVPAYPLVDPYLPNAKEYIARGTSYRTSVGTSMNFSYIHVNPVEGPEELGFRIVRSKPIFPADLGR